MYLFCFTFPIVNTVWGKDVMICREKLPMPTSFPVWLFQWNLSQVKPWIFGKHHRSESDSSSDSSNSSDDACIISIQLSSANLTPNTVPLSSRTFWCWRTSYCQAQGRIRSILVCLNTEVNVSPSYHPRPAQGKSDHWHQGYLWWTLLDAIANPQRVLHRRSMLVRVPRRCNTVWGGGTQRQVNSMHKEEEIKKEMNTDTTIFQEWQVNCSPLSGAYSMVCGLNRQD